MIFFFLLSLIACVVMGCAENDVTSQLPADGRAKNMEKLLVEIMRAKRVKAPSAAASALAAPAAAAKHANEDYLPRVIIMEDLHW